MQLHRMTASFGRLGNETLTLSAGLNVIEAPNESGKSTWCAFLRTMLYGLPSRDRSPLADKHKYAPWSGAPLSGSLSLSADGRQITLLRDTQRATAPMGRFSALYTGTGESVPGLTGTDCGETLLGVSREVWERSAFIGQSALRIDQSPELERRITALISTGEENTSYTEARERLKKQLTRRRHNKTGLLPVLEKEIAQLQEKRSLLQETQCQQQNAFAAHQEAQARLEKAQLLLDAHRDADACEAAAQLRQAQLTAQQTLLQLQAATRLMEESGFPSVEVLTTLQARIAAAAPLHTNVTEAGAALAAARQQEALCQAQLPGAPPLSPESIPLPPFLPAWLYALPLALSGALLALLLSLTQWPLPLLALLPAVMGLPLCLQARQKRRRSRETAMTARETAAQALTDYQTATAAAEAAHRQVLAAQNLLSGYENALHRLLQDIFAEIARFRTGIDTLSAAQAVLEEGLSRHRQWEGLRNAAQQADHALQLAQSRLPQGELPPQPVLRPAISLAQAQADWYEAKAQTEDALRRFDRLQGQLSTLADPDALTVQLEQLQERHRALEAEYAALQLALEVLEEANALLQTRFSPVLGARTAEIFSTLTADHWVGVTLDRSLGASALDGQSPLPRESGLLSLGAGDQLYLALRLAICELVLPPDTPLILDDALVRFDDARMAAALEFLLTLSRQRQILLFTCQSREAAYLAGRPQVRLLSL